MVAGSVDVDAAAEVELVLPRTKRVRRVTVQSVRVDVSLDIGARSVILGPSQVRLTVQEPSKPTGREFGALAVVDVERGLGLPGKVRADDGEGLRCDCGGVGHGNHLSTHHHSCQLHFPTFLKFSENP